MHRPIMCGVLASLAALAPPAAAWATESVHHGPLPVATSSAGIVPNPSLKPDPAAASPIIRIALRYLGTPYLFGGSSPRGFDCSGYVQVVFAEMGVQLPRMADEQFMVGKIVSGKPGAGDLVFFHTYGSGVSHVGIALGDDRFVHASSTGVTIASLYDPYYAPRYRGARRFLD